MPHHASAPPPPAVGAGVVIEARFTSIQTATARRTQRKPTNIIIENRTPHISAFKATSCASAITVYASLLAGSGGKIEPSPLYNQLLEAARDIRPKMIGIASSANVFAGNENDRAQVQQFAGLLTGLAIAADGAVQLISHPSLSGISAGTGVSGTTQWHNAVRARSFLKGIRRPAGQRPARDHLQEEQLRPARRHHRAAQYSGTPSPAAVQCKSHQQDACAWRPTMVGLVASSPSAWVPLGSLMAASGSGRERTTAEPMRDCLGHGQDRCC